MNIRKYWYVALLIVCVAVFLWAAMMSNRSLSETQGEARRYLLIDPGHGGEDGGTSGSDGTLEKDINLAVSLTARDLLSVLGYPVQMTRSEDVSLASEGDTVRARKVSDMKNRLVMYDSAWVTVSLHQNYFTQSKYYGTQIFYSGNRAESAVLAESIRTRVVEQLQPDNTRELKKADDNIFLLDETKTPAVLVECGFLSNEAEREKLKDPEYQKQLAVCVVGGLVDFLQTQQP